MIPESKILYKWEENNREGDEVDEEQPEGHEYSFTGLLKVFDAEIMINRIEASYQGDHQDYQQAIDVEDTVHQGGLPECINRGN